MIRFPYGIFDFKEIVTQKYFYCDRTHFIRTIEDTGNYLLFIRPRRFGKSLLLSMLDIITMWRKQIAFNRSSVIGIFKNF